MSCTNLEACHFIVCNGDEMHTDIIVFDPTFWGDIFCQLEVFYFLTCFSIAGVSKIKVWRTEMEQERNKVSKNGMNYEQ